MSTTFREALRSPGEERASAEPDDLAFALSMFAYASMGLAGVHLEAKTRRAIDGALSAAATEIGRWQLSWGPCVQMPVLGVSSVNTMFAVESLDRPGDVAIAVAGTNPTSVFDWLVEDVFVSQQSDWPYGGGRSAGAKVSVGTAVGLSVLQEMRPSGDRPGAGTTLTDHLSTAFSAGARIVVTGHSLGGALAPVLAQWLLDTRPTWDPGRRATISSICFAGPSPGNAAFAGYCLGDLGVRPRRRAVALDVVPHAWQLETLDQIPSLYAPFIPEHVSIVALKEAAKWLARGGDYLHVDPAALPIAGRVATDRIKGRAPYVEFALQMVYQHLTAYYESFGFKPAWAPWFAFVDELRQTPPFGRLVPPFFESLRPSVSFVTSTDGDAATAPAERAVRVGNEVLPMPEHAGDPRTATLRKEVSEVLARHG